MPHIFLQITGIRPGVNTPADLSAVIREDNDTTFSISQTVVDWLLGTIDFAAGSPLPKLKNCCFSLADGAEFIEFDGKGKMTTVSEKPAWYPEPGRFLREQWLINNEMYDLSIVAFIKEFLETFVDVKERRIHCNLLFDLQLDKVKSTHFDEIKQPASKLGNKNRKSTAPRVEDLRSFDQFQQFVERMASAVEQNQFPTMNILTGYKDIAKAPGALKGSARTWFKAITGELPPNNKKVAAGNAEIFCAPIRTALEAVRTYGLEAYYHELSQAIQQAGFLEVARFEFTPGH